MAEQTDHLSVLQARYLHILLLLLLTIVFFWPAVGAPESLIYPSYSPFSDLTVIHWPNAQQLSRVYDTFQQIPLWKNVSLSGMPAIANPLAMMYYPPDFLFLRFPIAVVFNFMFIAHVFISGLGLYLFLRSALGRSELACLVSATLYMFSGKLIAHVAAGHVSLVGAMAWLPLILLGVNRTVVKRSLIAAILTSSMLALQAVTHTQMFLYTIYFVVLYGGFELWGQVKGGRKTVDWPAVKRLLPVLLPIPVLTVALAAVQIVPLIELAPFSNRAFTLQQASEFALSFRQLLMGVFLPSAHVGHEATIYPGLVMLGLAFFSFFGSNKDRRFWFFLCAAVVGVVLSLGSGGLLFSALYWTAPGWRWMRASARVWLFVNLALAVLASYGFESFLFDVLPGQRKRWRSLVGFAIVVACALVGVGLILGYGQLSRATIVLIIVPALFLVLTWLYRASHLAPVLIATVILVLGVLDSGSFSRSLLVFKSPAEVFSERADVATRLATSETAQPFRIYSPSYSIPQHIAALFDLQLADGVEPVHLARYDRFMAVAGGYGDDSYTVTIPRFPENTEIRAAHRDTIPDARWLGLLNVRYFVSDFPVEVDGLTPDGTMGETYIYRNEREMPRAFAVSGVRVARDSEDAWGALSELDFSRTAVVETSDPKWIELLGGGDSAPVEADVVFFSPNKIVTEVNLAEPALLVLSEMWYPGWVAYDNGYPVSILRTNYLLRGVWLSAGHHSVAWLYRPGSLEWGLRISGVAALLSALVLVVVARRNASRAISGR